MDTRILTIDTPETFGHAVQSAAALLQSGQIVAVPTETVYGLAANGFSAEAVRLIYEAKGRPAQNPVIVHVSSLEMAWNCVSEWPEPAQTLAAHFWPGALTLVLPKSSRIPSMVTAGGSTVAIRWPDHPFVRELISRCGFPLAAPSANPASQISPTTAAHVMEGLNGKIPLIIDAGPSPVGIESTVVALDNDSAKILRPGMITAEQIRAVLKIPVSTTSKTSVPGILASPGLLEKHYAPRARTVVVSWKNEEDLAKTAAALGVPFDKIHILAHDKVPHRNHFGRISVIPHDPEAYARALYSELHACDRLGAGLIIIETVPQTAEWEGIRDRITRASSPA